MSNTFLNHDKLATLEELRYLLLEVLNRETPISRYDLSFSCKELSLNFVFAFENTITLLQLLGIIRTDAEGAVSRMPDENYEALETDHALALFIMRKAVGYLQAQQALNKVFNVKTIVQGQATGTYVVLTAEMPLYFQFTRLLLLNLGMASADEAVKGKLLIAKDYQDYFSEELLPKVIGNQPPDIVQAKKPTFFISYAHEDEEYKEELKKHFSGMVRSGIIESWDGRAILPGEDWDDEVKKKLEAAEVVLFLVSSDFIDSDYIHDVELKKAIERHNRGEVKIIPIIVRHCDFRSLPIGKFQFLPRNARPISKWKDKDEAYLNVVEGIKKII